MNLLPLGAVFDDEQERSPRPAAPSFLVPNRPEVTPSPLPDARMGESLRAAPVARPAAETPPSAQALAQMPIAMLPAGAVIDELIEEPNAPLRSAPVREQGFFSDVGGGAGRGWNAMQSGLGAVQFMTGMQDEDTFVRDVLKNGQDMLRYAKSPELVEQERRYQQSSGIGSLGTLLTSPRLLGSMVAESASSIIPGIVGAAGGGLAGGLVGSVPGAGLGAIAGGSLASAAPEYGAAFLGYLNEHGVDITNENALRTALRNPELVNAAHWDAAKRAGVAAGFAALGGALGGKFVPRFFAPGTGVGSKAAGVGVASGIGAGSEAATELFGDIATGSPLSAKDIIAAGVIGAILDFPGTLAEPVAENIAGRFQQRTEPPGAPGAPPPTPGTTGGIGGADRPLSQAEELARLERDAGLLSQEERERFTPSGPAVESRIVEAPNEPPANFYSALEDTIASPKVPESAPATQMAATLANAPGVKSEEIRDTGLSQYLQRAIEANRTVTKTEIKEYLAANEVVVTEQKQADSGYDQYILPSPERTAALAHMRNVPTYVSFQFEDPIEYTEYSFASPRKFAFQQNVAPRYPVRRTFPTSPRFALLGRITNEFVDSTGRRDFRFSNAPLATASSEWSSSVRIPDPALEDAPPKHYGRDDVFAHARTSVRKDAESRKVFFIEEVQSDWYQKARRTGALPAGVPISDLQRSVFEPKNKEFVGFSKKLLELVALDQRIKTLADTTFIEADTFDSNAFLQISALEVVGGIKNRSIIGNVGEAELPGDMNFEFGALRLADPKNAHLVPEDMRSLMEEYEQKRQELGYQDVNAYSSDRYSTNMRTDHLPPEWAEGVTDLPDPELPGTPPPGLFVDNPRPFPGSYYYRNGPWTELKPPSGSFMDSWAEVVFKRMMNIAAAKGISRVGWTHSSEQVRRYGAGDGGKVERGMQKFYDNDMVKIAQKWAKRTGGSVSTAKVDGETVHVFEMSPTAVKEIVSGRGLPLWSSKMTAEELTAHQAMTPEQLALLRPRFGPLAIKLAKTTVEMAKAVGVGRTVRINLRYDDEFPGTFGHMFQPGNGLPNEWLIEVWPLRHFSPEHLYTTFMHELGHIVQFEMIDGKQPSLLTALEAAHQIAKQNWTPKTFFSQVLAERYNFVSRMEIQPRIRNDSVLGRFSPQALMYEFSFEEWFAEQFAKWTTTDERPLTMVDHFFSAMVKAIKKAFVAFREMVLGKQLPGTVANASANKDLASFLNAQMDKNAPWVKNLIDTKLEVTAIENGRALAKAGFPHVKPAPFHRATRAARDAMRKLFGKEPIPTDVAAALASTDRFNKFYEWMITLPQLAKRNPDILALQRYNEIVQIMNLEKVQMMDRAMATLGEWNKIGKAHDQGLHRMIDDYMNMTFLDPQERAQGVIRRPSPDELRQMAQATGAGDAGLAVFLRVQTDLDTMLEQYRQILIKEANTGSDPVVQAEILLGIEKQIASMKSAPYFPALRFGDYVVMVKDSGGRLVHMEAAESKRAQTDIYMEVRQQFPPSQGYQLIMKVLAKDTRTMRGMPDGILELMQQKLALSPTQIEALEILKFENSPQHKALPKRKYAAPLSGYSDNFKRVFGSYFFHGANHFVRVKYASEARGHIATVRDEADQLPNGNKRSKIANFMADHMSEYLDPKPDIPFLRSATFVWHLSFSPASAAMNLTQLVFATGPFLASKFGTFKAAAALTKASSSIGTFYKGKTLETMTEPEFRALSEGVKDGTITEAMAPELAAISDGRNLEARYGTPISKGVNTVMKLGAGMFSMAEQVNRRVTFRAAWAMAMENLNAPYVQEIASQHTKQYEKLRLQGWPANEALAYITAKDAVQATQFIYSKYAQAKFMRGHRRVLFAFHTFVQNMLFFLWNYKSAGMKSMLVMAGLGGMMGIPGAEDLLELIKSIGWRFYGKDWNVEREIREYVKEITGSDEAMELVLHGSSRYGFGVPTLMSMLGVDFPSFDRSGSIGLGQISPIPLGLFGPPTQDTDTRIARGLQDMAGATFGVGFNIFRAMTDHQLEPTDPRRWERAVPQFMRNAGRAFRAWDGGLENRSGANMVKFDVNDPYQMAEVFGLAAGYMPTRAAQQFDRTSAQIEIIAYWDLRRNILLSQLDAARRENDPAIRRDVLAAIRSFNAELPRVAKAKAITSDTIQQSLQARARNRTLQERGLPVQRSNVGLARQTQELYPVQEIGRQRVQ